MEDADVSDVLGEFAHNKRAESRAMEMKESSLDI